MKPLYEGDVGCPVLVEFVERNGWTGCPERLLSDGICLGLTDDGKFVKVLFPSLWIFGESTWVEASRVRRVIPATPKNVSILPVVEEFVKAF